MASAQAVKIGMLKEIAIQSSQALIKVTAQLSNINSNSSTLTELLGATLSCTLLHEPMLARSSGQYVGNMWAICRQYVGNM
jgi:hypothetical protein